MGTPVVGKMRANCELMRARSLGRMYTSFARKAIPPEPARQLGSQRRFNPNRSLGGIALRDKIREIKKSQP